MHSSKNFSKSKILFLVQLPPPVHGVSIMNKYVLENDFLLKKFETKILPLDFGQTLNDIGKITFKKLQRMVFFSFRLVFFLAKYRPDIVYFTIMPTGKIFYRDAFFALLIRFFCPKLILHLHGKGIYQTTQRSRFKKILYKKVLRSSKLICLSHTLKDDVSHLIEKEPYILANGVPIMKVENTYKNKNSVPNILFLSNLVKSKGIEVFLNSIVELNKLGLKFEVSIIGNSVDYTIEEANFFCRENNLENKVFVLGPKYGKDKVEALYKSDIFVLPSFNECFPLAILEAMQAGKPIVSTKVGGIPDIIKDGIEGFLVEPNNTQKLTEVLKLLINDEALRLKLGEGARNKFIANYTLEQFQIGIVQIFEMELNNSA